MRTIKFRGKRQSDEKWAYGSLVYSENIKPAIYFEVGKGEVKMLDWCYVNPDTIGQFTSLKDKYGRDIYEGDILEADGCSLYQKLEVRFVRGVFAFLWDGNLDDEFPTGSPTHEWAKVIGNIHDNPELLSK